MFVRDFQCAFRHLLFQEKKSFFGSVYTGLPRSEKRQGKLDLLIQGRGKSGSFESSQGISKFLFKVSKKSGNLILRLS